MAGNVQYTNKDGLIERFGVETVEDKRARSARGKVVEELLLSFAYSDVTAAASTGFYDKDSSGGDTPDSFSDRIGFIPANSVIVGVYLIPTVAWTGTATLDIGFESKAGAVQDADALYDGLDVSSATVGLGAIGVDPVPNGVLYRATSGTYDPDGIAAINANMYVRPVNADAGTLTAGEAKLVVQFIRP